jgi:CSLREA domain-containing protein
MGLRKISCFMVSSFMVLLLGMATAKAATITVDSLGDTIVNDGTCTLREAITAANTDVAVDTCTAGDPTATAVDVIQFDAIVTGTINTTTLPNITDSVTINGPGAAVLTIDGDASGRLLRIDSGNNSITVNIDNLTFTGGAGAFYLDATDSLNLEAVVITNNTVTGDGAAVDNAGGILIINDSSITDNTASSDGGAIATDRWTGSDPDTPGTTIITNTTLSGNTATTGDGGAIYNEEGSTTTVENCTITGNTAGSEGGGLWNEDDCPAPNCTTDTPATLMVINSTISDNHAVLDGGGIGNDSLNGTGTVLIVTGSTIYGNTTGEDGAGINNENSNATVTITNSTISGNEADSYGGGILNESDTDNTITITNSTIVHNTADFNDDDLGVAGGIYVGDGTNNTVTLINTILADNIDNNTTPAPDCYTDSVGETLLTSGGNNLIGDITGCTDHDFDDVALNDQIGDAGGTGAIDPLLDSLDPADGGDPAAGEDTGVHVPLDGSPAIDGVDNSIALPPATDQRGVPRSQVATDTTDIGAVEVGCGNGIVEAAEQCDDGGESATCNANCTTAVCGDSIVNATAGEQCDDGNTTAGDGCSDTCQTEGAGLCGNGVIDGTEECDDGNTTDGDGCSSTCTNEGAAVCGDNILQAGEECDDGNTLSGDGCSSTCEDETGGGDGCSLISFTAPHGLAIIGVLLTGLIAFLGIKRRRR